jgi:hypothetical protein
MPERALGRIGESERGQEDRMAEAARKLAHQRERVSFLVPSSIAKEVMAEAYEEGISMTEYWKRAAAVYSYFRQKRAEGKKLFVGESPRAIEVEVTLL